MGQHHVMKSWDNKVQYKFYHLVKVFIKLSKMKIILIFMVILFVAVSLADLLAQNRLCNNRLIQYFRRSQILVGKIHHAIPRKAKAKSSNTITGNKKSATLKIQRKLRRKYFTAYWRKRNRNRRLWTISLLKQTWNSRSAFLSVISWIPLAYKSGLLIGWEEKV